MEQPLVFIEVRRPDGDTYRVKVSAELLLAAKHPCALLTAALNEALRNAGYKL